MLYLASKSRRRKEILQGLGIPFRIVSSRYQERRIPGMAATKLALIHAKGKAVKAVVSKKARWILGADTLVALRGKILGKPQTKREALGMLRLLSGRPHWVVTALALLDRKTGKIKTGVARTKVIFKKLSGERIRNYLEAVDPFDKAGGYAIQEGPRIVKKIQGSYTNVVGLPVELLKEMLG